METSGKLIIGARLKVLRKSLGLTQAQMAEQVGVSSSYITLIESDQRPASAKLLVKLAQVYDLNISELAPEVDTQLTSDFSEALKDPVLDVGKITRSEIDAVLRASPKIARALVQLQSRNAQSWVSADVQPVDEETERAVASGQLIRPSDQVRAWLYEKKNYIDPLDRAAEALSEELKLARNEPNIALTERLAGHGLRIQIVSAKRMAGALRRYDPLEKLLSLSELLGQPSRRFQMAIMIVHHEHDRRFKALLEDMPFTDPEALSLARVTMANYFAAALLMPYQRFFEACETERYDLELLSHRFGTSFEQTAHRMSTLQRPEARGVPFFIVRVDRAGNVSKRFSAGRFPFSSFGGTCPLWNIHSAFETPGQINTQIIRMPEGGRYFSIARTINRVYGGHNARPQRLVLGLGCDIAHAPRLIYSESLDLDAIKSTEIGLNCYLCERSNCPSRAQAPINRKLAVNELERSLALYRFEGETTE